MTARFFALSKAQTPDDFQLLSAALCHIAKRFHGEVAMIASVIRLFRKRALFLILLLGIGATSSVLWHRLAPPEPWRVARRVPTAGAPSKIVRGAKTQIGTFYDASYQEINYPNGDVSRTRRGQKVGACSDVVIRALRFAGWDLQRLMHEDMTRNFAQYPPLWGLTAPNASIDHRRVPNQMTFFTRFGRVLPTDFSSSTRTSWQPGDIVCWDTGNGRTHTGVLSDGVDQRDVPLVIHNNGICREDNCLQRWKIIGHFRFPK